MFVTVTIMSFHLVIRYTNHLTPSTIKNAAGKTICKVDEKLGIIEIQAKGCRTYLWFEHGHIFSLNEPIPPDKLHNRT